MCAYNAIDGVPACASTMLLDKYPARRLELPGLRHLRLRRYLRLLLAARAIIILLTQPTPAPSP